MPKDTNVGPMQIDLVDIVGEAAAPTRSDARQNILDNIELYAQTGRDQLAERWREELVDFDAGRSEFAKAAKRAHPKRRRSREALGRTRSKGDKPEYVKRSKPSPRPADASGGSADLVSTVPTDKIGGDDRERVDRPSSGPLLKPVRVSDLPEPEFVIGPPFMFARGQVGLIAAPTGLGKTTIMAALGLYVTQGVPILGADVRKGRTLFLDFERVQETVRRAVIEFGKTLDIDPDHEPFHYVQPNWSLQDEWVVPQLIEEVRDGAYAVVIIDNLETALSLDSNEGQEARDAMDLFRRIAKETGTAVVLIDHTPKTNGSTPTGSTKKMDFARPVHVLKPLKGKAIRWTVLKPAFGRKPADFDFMIVESAGAMSLRLCYEAESPQKETDDISEDERCALEALREAGPLNKSAIYEAVAAKRGDRHKATTKRRFQRNRPLEGLVEKQLIRKVDKPERGDFYEVS